MLDVLLNGDYFLANIGVVKEIYNQSIVFIVNEEDIEILVDAEMLDNIKEIDESNEIALFPIDLATKTILMDAIPVAEGGGNFGST